VHIGHSTGGGEVAHYVARAKAGRVAKAVLIGAVPPVHAQVGEEPAGLPIEVFDGIRAAVLTNPRAVLHRPADRAFYGYNRPGARISRGLSTTGGAGNDGRRKAHYDCVKAFSETDFTEDLKKIDVPTLVMHGDRRPDRADRRFRAAGREAAEEGTLKTYDGFPHGMATPRTPT
jgi:non-heme chloroperoxidase